MSAPPPIPCMWSESEGVFRPLPNFLRVAHQHYGAGEVVPLAPLEPRSRASHDHYFACVHQAWQSLPEDQAERFKDEDTLRKHALICTGYRNEATTACMFKTEARRLAATLMQQGGDYAIVVVNDRVVTRYTAKSQSLKAMGRETFQRSKDDVLTFLADLIGVEPQALTRARAA